MERGTYFTLDTPKPTRLLVYSTREQRPDRLSVHVSSHRESTTHVRDYVRDPHLRTAGHRSGLGPITLRTRPACQPRAQPVTACGVGVLGDVVARCGDDIVGTNAVTRHGRALPRTRPTPRGRTTSRTGDSKYKVTSVTALVEAPLSHPESKRGNARLYVPSHSFPRHKLTEAHSALTPPSAFWGHVHVHVVFHVTATPTASLHAHGCRRPSPRLV